MSVANFMEASHADYQLYAAVLCNGRYVILSNINSSKI